MLPGSRNDALGELRFEHIEKMSLSILINRVGMHVGRYSIALSRTEL